MEPPQSSPPEKEEQPKTPSPPPPQPPATHNHTATCCNCGGPTSFPPPPSWSEISPPPTYRPIRAPAINLPPNINPQQAIILAPVPQSQKVPVVSPPYQFQTPAKKIHSQDDIRHFQDSESGKNFLGFVVALSESICGHKISDPCHQSPIINSIISIIESLIQYVDDIPPMTQSARYGNLSYRTWHGRMIDNAESFMLQFLPDELQSAPVELVPYFGDSFGNWSRIDYGTGHETNFAAWLYCLTRLGLIKEEDYQAVVSRVFVKYLELMRKLQLVYCLEPAGSHGVWGLDDYHFLPFIFGSSQLIDHKYMKPKSIHNEDILENFSNEYLYISCIAFVKKVKKGLFAEHSPLLDDISGVPTWNKVNNGLLKMYKVEVLEKVPIMQHFLFGWLIKCGWLFSATKLVNPFFALLDAEVAHQLAVSAAARGWVPKEKRPDPSILGLEVWGRRFSNPIGFAAGFDKNAEAVEGLLGLGFGSVEVGSVTPVPQEGNPKPRIFRLRQEGGIINSCGFNSEGIVAVAKRLGAQHGKRKLDETSSTSSSSSDEVKFGGKAGPGILGVDLGKNKTSEDVAADYVQGVDMLSQYADYLVINVSSLNTPGLCQLRGRKQLKDLVKKVQAARDEMQWGHLHC